MIMGASDAESLQRSMKAVSHDLEEDFHGISEGFRELGVWRSYVETYPWCCLGAAAMVGYLVVPKRQKSRTSEMSCPTQESQLERLPATSNSPSHQTLREVTINALGDAAMRGVATYIGIRVGRVLEAYRQNNQDEPS
jgi:hypothetical protein